MNAVQLYMQIQVTSEQHNVTEEQLKNALKMCTLTWKPEEVIAAAGRLGDIGVHNLQAINYINHVATFYSFKEVLEIKIDDAFMKANPRIVVPITAIQSM